MKKVIFSYWSDLVIEGHDINKQNFCSCALTWTGWECQGDWRDKLEELNYLFDEWEEINRKIPYVEGDYL